MIITKRLVSSFGHLMKGKLFFFKRRSLPRYLVASLLLGFVSPVLGFSGLAAAGVYFVGIMI